MNRYAGVVVALGLVMLLQAAVALLRGPIHVIESTYSPAPPYSPPIDDRGIPVRYYRLLDLWDYRSCALPSCAPGD